MLKSLLLTAIACTVVTRHRHIVWWPIGEVYTPPLFKLYTSGLVSVTTIANRSVLRSVTITGRNFAVIIMKTICEVQDHLGTSRRHQKSYNDLSARRSPFEVNDCVWTIHTYRDLVWWLRICYVDVVGLSLSHLWLILVSKNYLQTLSIMISHIGNGYWNSGWWLLGYFC